MVEVAFYQLSKSPLEVVLPTLLQNTLKLEKRAVVLTGSKERLKTISSFLWTSQPGSWIPHGSKTEGNSTNQPIWLSTHFENPNSAVYLFLIDGIVIEEFDNFRRCFDIFDGKDDSVLSEARDRWKYHKQAGHECKYYQQDLDGKWKENP